MKLRSLALALAISSALIAPAQAAIGITNKVQNQNSGAHTLTSSSFTPAAGSVIVVTGTGRVAATGDTLIYTNSTAEATTGQQCILSAGSDRYSFMFWYKTAGGAQTASVSDTVTGATNFIAATLNVAELTGVDQTTVEEAVVRACNNNGGTVSTAPTVTSGAPTLTGMAVSVWSDGNSTGISFTEDATWNFLNGTGNTNVVSQYASKAYTGGGGAVTRTATSASRGYSMQVMGFIEAGGAPAGATSRSLLLGVGK